MSVFHEPRARALSHILIQNDIPRKMQRNKEHFVVLSHTEVRLAVTGQARPRPPPVTFEISAANRFIAEVVQSQSQSPG